MGSRHQAKDSWQQTARARGHETSDYSYQESDKANGSRHQTPSSKQQKSDIGLQTSESGIRQDNLQQAIDTRQQTSDIWHQTRQGAAD